MHFERIIRCKFFSLAKRQHKKNTYLFTVPLLYLHQLFMASRHVPSRPVRKAVQAKRLFNIFDVKNAINKISVHVTCHISILCYYRTHINSLRGIDSRPVVPAFYCYASFYGKPWHSRSVEKFAPQHAKYRSRKTSFQD